MIKDNKKCNENKFTASNQADAQLKANRPGNEAGAISLKRKLAEIAVLLLSGWLAALTVPDLNWTAAAWFCLIPLYWLAGEKTLWKGFLCGYIWGLTWIFAGFFWLREIQFAIPFLIAPILALGPALWGMAVSGLRRNMLYPANIRSQGQLAMQEYTPKPMLEFFLAVVLAAAWCLTEWGRAWLLPWNFLSASQWQNLPLIQLCRFTGTYGVSFLIVMINITFAMAIKNGLSAAKAKKYRRPLPFMLSMLLLMAAFVLGTSYSKPQPIPEKNKLSFKAGLVQGDISQRRRANNEEAREALEVYMKLSAEVAKLKPDIIIWPETAVPYPYRANLELCREYRFSMFSLIDRIRCPFLIGTIDFEDLPPGSTRLPGTTNAAMLLNSNGMIGAKYDKVHPVPFGEYVPFRKYLPQWVINAIDMHRDLTPGTSLSPLEILPQIKAGISICFEDVFSYISRRETQLGANLLLVITNDAWYPTSSEPAQHLANSVFRAIETGLPMLRCGNNSATCLISPTGKITACLMTEDRGSVKNARFAPEKRGRCAGIIKVELNNSPEPTFFTRFGNVFIVLCWIIFATGTVKAVWNWRSYKLGLVKCFE